MHRVGGGAGAKLLIARRSRLVAVACAHRARPFVTAEIGDLAQRDGAHARDASNAGHGGHIAGELASACATSSAQNEPRQPAVDISASRDETPPHALQ